MEASELRGRTEEELKANLDELKQELFNLRFQVVIGQLENPMRAKKARRNIARIQTILREREMVGG